MTLVAYSSAHAFDCVDNQNLSHESETESAIFTRVGASKNLKEIFAVGKDVAHRRPVVQYKLKDTVAGSCQET